MKILPAIAISVAFSATNTAASEPSIHLTAGLTECTGQLEAAATGQELVEGLSAARISSRGALEYLVGGHLDAQRRSSIISAKEEFSQQLLRDPMNSRSLVAKLKDRCMELVYQAEDFRVDETQRAQKEVAAEKMAAAEKRQKEAEAERQAAIQADRANALELAKMNAEIERLKILKQSELDSEKNKLTLEAHKLDTTAKIDLGKIHAETDRLEITERASVEMQKTKAEVDTARIRADAGVAITGRLADAAIAREAAVTERTVVETTAKTEIAKNGAQALRDVSTNMAEADIARSAAAVEIKKIDAKSQITSSPDVDLAFPAVRNGSEDPDTISTALECGAFYRSVAERAPSSQRSAVVKISATMFDYARSKGASEDIIARAPSNLSTKLNSAVAGGKQLFQTTLLEMKERCSNLSVVINS